MTRITCVGWVEARNAETQQAGHQALGFTAFYPAYGRITLEAAL